MNSSLTVLLVDPSLFTAPYDSALTRGLQANGIEVIWAIRPLRENERSEIDPEIVRPVYYLKTDRAPKRATKIRLLSKGIAHLAGSSRLLNLVKACRPDIVHFQWPVLPLVDCIAFKVLSLHVPLVLTVHDTYPFNGNPSSRIQTLGFSSALRAADHLIVHTEQGRQSLLTRGCSNHKVSVVPHGPLRIGSSSVATKPRLKGRPWTIVAFGRLRPYKGLDLLIEATGHVPVNDRGKFRIVIAGEPLMPVEPMLQRVQELGTSDIVEFRLRRHSDQEMADLFGETDAFVFPYREIEASGVYSLVSSLDRWIIASNIGVFKEQVQPSVTGSLVERGNVEELAAALSHSVGRYPAGGSAPSPSWEEIGRRTMAIYQQLITQRRNR